ncbi:hypothetical protein DND132_0195 [Pseudodesulfovibrio mercurii]|uniref:Uncharacterized protein n=2 Tax=Pseudodesulfovibrio mercurii TaxID=641491 RepID=F0JDX3_9BACT|nr:hypothetical protein DND132_0195 [Pseudodesulfovibrio mercurii]
MKELFLVHCVDTEGPLYESLTATFERIRQTFGLNFKPSTNQLNRLKAGKDVPEALRANVMDFVSDARLDYNATWTEVDAMLHELMSDDWRMRHADDFGNGYVFSWFVMDHVGFTTNPRQRALGFHAVYEHYQQILSEYTPEHDALYWHFHPVPFSHAANRASCNYSFTNCHIESIGRRLLDHLDFPSAFRPGLHCERPDIHLFLEMWIPVDFGNQAMPERAEDAIQKDVSGGRFGDWRRAKSTWGVYHPDWYDYQKPGGMKRYIARCLNLNARIRPITREEIERAFRQVRNGEPTILSVTSHDQNKMGAPITRYMDLIRDVQKQYPEVRIRHANAVDAVRRVCGVPEQSPVRFDIAWTGNRVDVRADKDIWGPQPWMSFKTLDQRYLHENMDRQDGNHWSFTFDADSIPLGSLEAIAFATNDNYFNSSAYRIPIVDGKPGEPESSFRNHKE